MITALPLSGYAPNNEHIGDHLVALANNVCDGEFGNVRTAILLIENSDGKLIRQTCGQTCDLARVVGLLSIAATRAATGDEE